MTDIGEDNRSRLVKMKTVKRIILVLLSLVMGLIILLAGSIAIDFTDHSLHP